MEEIPGPKHSPNILQYFGAVDLSPHFKRDETPWCAAYVNYCLSQAGLTHTRSPLALSFMKWGNPIPRLTAREGDLCVFKDITSSYKGHVGLFICYNKRKTRILILGGNQNNSVCFQWYPLKSNRLCLLDIRRL